MKHNHHRAFFSRYNRARRVMRREFIRGSKNYNVTGHADLFVCSILDDWSLSNIPEIKPYHVATAARRRRFRKERNMRFNNPSDGLC